eukprot:TRINITY_DN7183_c0_g1_i1.p2 TRINITY_DN7183_c0_g1~~TRINITY_DN7183_c0_g1_i1.p2  ORF type:complete len:287 (+),score=94.50 TRINITY_DN7183_c0_g1_i1:904-1764(+)
MKTELGHADLNIPAEPKKTLKDRVLRALQLGYQTVAINTVVNQENLFNKKQMKNAKDKESAMMSFPEPVKLELTDAELKSLPNQTKKPTILSRLTILFFHNDFLIHYNKSEAVKNYDLLAVVPKTSLSLLNLMKSSFKFDIVSLNLDYMEEFRWHRKLYREVLGSHAHFEMNYAEMISNRDVRRRNITLAQNMFWAGKCKGILLSSGASRTIYLRPPADVANLSMLLAMTEAQGKEAVLNLPTLAYKAALGRKMGTFRVRVEVVNKEESSSDEGEEEGMDVEQEIG